MIFGNTGLIIQLKKKIPAIQIREGSALSILLLILSHLQYFHLGRETAVSKNEIFTPCGLKFSI